MCLIVEAANGVGQVTVGAAVERPPEMALLAQLGALIGHLPAYPLGNVVFSTWIRRTELPGLLSQVGHDRAGLENRNRLTASHRLIVHNCRHPAVGRHLEKSGRELVSATDIDRLEGVWEA